jgi:predicted DNA-binding transcriptional regulator YafY
MRASRLLSILMLLQARGRLTAETLAAELEVSVRTIYRDIDELSASGVPVYADRGPNGGFALLDGYRTRLTGLTPDEARALLLAGLPGPAAALGLGEALAGAQLKLLAALPVEGSAAAQATGARFHLDPVGWFQGAEEAARVPVLADAIWRDRRIRMRYRRWTGVVEREACPLGLVLKAGIWYLVASVEDAIRTYRVSSIQALDVFDAGFERPAGFDLAAHWVNAARRYEASVYTGTARLRATREGLRRLALISGAVAEAVADAEPPAEDCGWVEVEIPIESIDQAAGEVLRLHADVEALGPLALVERVSEATRALAARYGIISGSSQAHGR